MTLLHELQPGDLVEVRSVAEVIASLDVDGKLDGLPFMPEMLSFCGRRYRVSGRVEQVCGDGQRRQLPSTVHLEQLCCDGSAHRNCQAACLLLWKEAWLRRVGNGLSGPAESTRAGSNLGGAYRSLGKFAQPSGDKLMCQATQLNAATSPLPLSRPLLRTVKIFRDYLRRKTSTAELRMLYSYFWGRVILAAFRRWARAPWNVSRYRTTPMERLELQPGEWVRVRGIREILRTLDRKGCNRGLTFEPNMFQYCGRKFRVVFRVERRIDDSTGQLREVANPCILLDSVRCCGKSFMCHRRDYLYWREIWLRRCQPENSAQPAQ
jgi:hypothetical protein